MIERCFIRVVVLVGLLMVGWGDGVLAQFHEMEGLPWVPVRPEKKNGNADDRGVVVLDELSAALQNGEYRQVVDRLYPLAISSGFQRNTNLYNQTRRALRQLLQEPNGAVYWNKMERLYHDRFANLGKEDYRYRNTLETASWSEEQLNNSSC